MRVHKVRPALHGGLDRWLAGQAVLRRDIHHWITARHVLVDRRRAIAVRHSGTLGGATAAVMLELGPLRGLTAAAAGAAWAVQAWRRAPEPPPPPDPADIRREAYLRLFDAIIGDRTGVHLHELYDTMRRYQNWADRTDQQLRALLDDLDVPVRRTMRVGTVVGRSGIHRDDVHALMTGIPVPSPPPTAQPLPPGEEAGHNGVEEGVERGVERTETPADPPPKPPKPPPAPRQPTPVAVTQTRPDDEPAWPPTTKGPDMSDRYDVVDCTDHLRPRRVDSSDTLDGAERIAGLTLSQHRDRNAGYRTHFPLVLQIQDTDTETVVSRYEV